MNGFKIGLLIGSALALQACAAGAPTRESANDDADQLIHGIMTPEELSCPKHTTMFCTGNGRLSMNCSCENPAALATALGAGFSGYW
jgi:hypothetical protein